MNQPIGVDIKTSKDFMFWTVDFSKEGGIFGYPTCDASGPVANIISSVAISSSSDEATQNASWEFVKIMLDEDIQRTETYGMPINKAAFIEQSQNSIESINTSYNRLKELGYPESVINEFGFGFVEDFYVDDLFEIAISIDNISSLDSSIEPILIEELGAYFANQKSIDDVIQIINNRVQTVIDERGN